MQLFLWWKEALKKKSQVGGGSEISRSPATLIKFCWFLSGSLNCQSSTVPPQYSISCSRSSTQVLTNPVAALMTPLKFEFLPYHLPLHTTIFEKRDEAEVFTS